MSSLKVIVVSGLPCIGKSTIAYELAKSYRIPVLSVDPIESAILESGFKRNFETGLAAYLVVKKLAQEQLNIELSVVIDAVSPVKEARDMWKEIAEKYTATLTIIECILDEKTHKTRVNARNRAMPGIPEVTWEFVEKVKDMYLPWKEDRLIIDTARDTKLNVESALEYIDRSSN